MGTLWDFISTTGWDFVHTFVLSFLVIAVPNFIYIGLRAFQTQNIVGGNYTALWIAGLPLAVSEAYLIQHIAERGPTLVVILGLWVGGSSGAQISMKAHRILSRFYKPSDIKPDN